MTAAGFLIAILTVVRLPAGVPGGAGGSDLAGAGPGGRRAIRLEPGNRWQS